MQENQSIETSGEMVSLLRFFLVLQQFFAGAKVDCLEKWTKQRLLVALTPTQLDARM